MRLDEKSIAAGWRNDDPPKDGPQFLACTLDKTGVVFFHIPYYSETMERWEPDEPHFWMALPEPPTGTF